MNKMHRAQICFDPEQHETLAEIARRDGTSISEIVRSAVQEWLTERQEDELIRLRLEELEQINRHRGAILARRGGTPLEVDLVETIQQMREERDDELLASTYGGRS